MESDTAVLLLTITVALNCCFLKGFGWFSDGGCGMVWNGIWDV